MPEDFEPEPDEADDNIAAMRGWATRLKKRCRTAEQTAAQVPRLKLENACLRIGLDPDEPGVKLLLAQYQGPPEPEAIRDAWLELTTSVLGTSFSQGQTLGSLAERVAANGGGPPSDDPDEAELALARAREALR